MKHLSLILLLVVAACGTSTRIYDLSATSPPPAATPAQAAMVAVARALMNTDEFLTRE